MKEILDMFEPSETDRSKEHNVSISYDDPTPSIEMEWKEVMGILHSQPQIRENKDASISYKPEGKLVSIGTPKVMNQEQYNIYLSDIVRDYADNIELQGIFEGDRWTTFLGWFRDLKQQERETFVKDCKVLFFSRCFRFRFFFFFFINFCTGVIFCICL